MIKRLLPLVLTLSLAATFSPPAQAGDRFDDMASSLGLTADQKEDVSTIVYEAREKRIAIKAREAAAKLELEHLMASATVDERAILKALDAVNAASADMRRNRVDQALAMRKVLSPEQWTQLASMWSEGKEERGERRERRDEDEGDDD